MGKIIKSFIILTFLLILFKPIRSTDSCCEDNSILVSGTGKLSVAPDIAIVNVGVQVTASTSKAATQGVATKLSQITKIMRSNQINSKDI
jgi:uncharacterized protein YggE